MLAHSNTEIECFEVLNMTVFYILVSLLSVVNFLLTIILLIMSTVLRGHRMNLEYSGRRLASETSLPVNDLPTLLDSLALQSCLAQGKPPSLKAPVNRLNLISSIVSTFYGKLIGLIC